MPLTDLVPAADEHSQSHPPAQPFSLEGLSQRERSRLRLLARRYRVRQDTTVRPWADVVFDLRLRHGLQLSIGQVLELVD
jgi:hypothetical protein